MIEKPSRYGKYFMKIKFNLDDNLFLNKILNLHNLTIIVWSVFQENNSYYPGIIVWVIKILQYERTNVSERIDINKSNKSRACMICHYWYFKDIDCKFEPCVCGKCNEISMMADELDNIKILNVKGVDYGCVFWNTTRHGAVNRLNNSNLHVKDALWISILLQIKHFLN